VPLIVCVWLHTHSIKDYKSSNSRVNARLCLLLYVYVAHTHESNSIHMWYEMGWDYCFKFIFSFLFAFFNGSLILDDIWDNNKYVKHVVYFYKYMYLGETWCWSSRLILGIALKVMLCTKHFRVLYPSFFLLSCLHPEFWT